MITRANIAKYWYNKGINKNTFRIEELSDNSDFNEVELVVIDLGEPGCWACGKPIINGDAHLNLSINQRWNQSGLERCHILAKQFGGKDVAENLFLLCHRCHLASPDTRNSNNFFAWIITRKIKGGYIGDIKEGIMKAAECKHMNIEEIDEKILEKELHKSDNSEKIIKSMHLNSGFHGGQVVDSTIYMNFIDEIYKREQ